MPDEGAARRSLWPVQRAGVEVWVYFAWKMSPFTGVPELVRGGQGFARTERESGQTHPQARRLLPALLQRVRWRLLVNRCVRPGGSCWPADTFWTESVPSHAVQGPKWMRATIRKLRMRFLATDHILRKAVGLSAVAWLLLAVLFLHAPFTATAAIGGIVGALTIVLSPLQLRKRGKIIDAPIAKLAGEMQGRGARAKPTEAGLVLNVLATFLAAAVMSSAVAFLMGLGLAHTSIPRDQYVGFPLILSAVVVLGSLIVASAFVNTSVSDH